MKKTYKLHQSDFSEPHAKIAWLMETMACPTRIAILHLLHRLGPEMVVQDIIHHLDSEYNIISTHLTRMRDRGVLTSRKDGQYVYYKFKDEVFRQVLQLMLESEALKKAVEFG